MLVTQSCLALCNPLVYSLPGLSMELSRQEYFSESPFPSPGVPTDSGIKLRSPAWWADSLPFESEGKPN